MTAFDAALVGLGLSAMGIMLATDNRYIYLSVAGVVYGLAIAAAAAQTWGIWP